MSDEHLTADRAPANSYLTILRKERRPDKNGKPWWQYLCRCVCGTEKWIPIYPVRNGVVVSCGCRKVALTAEANTTHGMSKYRIFRVWVGIKARCNNRQKREYADYGGRGIRLCPEWHAFPAFYAHILPLLPDGLTDIPKHLTIERIDTNGHYEPGNVKLATRKEQNRNTRRNRLVTIDGVTRCVAEWAELNGIGYQRANTRIYKGWDPVLAVTTPPPVRRARR